MIAFFKQEVVKPNLEENLGLAYKAALKFVSRNVEVEDTDEYADALEALWKACESWTPERGKFSTHAHWCMKNAIINGRRDRKRKSIETDPLEDVVDSRSNELPPEVLIDLLFTESPDESEVNKRNKRVLFRHYIENISWDELGRQFGVTKNRATQ